MYTPTAFLDDDLPSLHSLIRQTRLGILVSYGEQGLIVSHIPLLLAEEGEYGTLSGHVAKANSHCQALTAGAPTMVIFQGADAYVSPSFYPAKAEHGKVVPTWNYVAVHAHGTPQVFTEAEPLLELVRQLTDRHEAGRSEPWAVSDAPADYIDGMLKAIVGFRLPIERLQGKRKLSQNRSPADIAGVREGLAASSDLQDQALSHLMQSL